MKIKVNVQCVLDVTEVLDLVNERLSWDDQPSIDSLDEFTDQELLDLLDKDWLLEEVQYAEDAIFEIIER